MKIILTENQLQKLVNEEITHIEDFFELLSNTTYEVFMSIKNKQKITFNLIDPNQYKKALEEYMKYGQFVRFPERYILDWKDLCLTNIALLNTLTEIHGHSSNFPFDEFFDVFNVPPKKQKNDWSLVYKILDEKYHIDDYVPFFSNGHAVLSDYGLEPLNKLAEVLIGQSDPNNIIITINKIMDVAHQRSDLSELFLRGGQASHYIVSNT